MGLLKKRNELSAIFFVLVGLSTPAAHAQTVPTDPRPAIDWRVEDRFRLFSEAGEEAKGRVDRLMERIRLAAPGTTLDTYHDGFLDVLAGNHGESLRTSNYEPPARGGRLGSGRYDRAYLYPDSYEIRVRIDDARLASATCRWTTAVDRQEGPCRDEKRVRVGPGGRIGERWGVATTLRLSVDGGPDHSYEISFPDSLIIALGDSYISGEGNPDVPSVITDRPLRVFEHASWGAKLSEARGEYRRATWWDEPCHRTLLSWPVLASLSYAARRPREAVTLVHVGCSGAVVDDLIDQGEVELPGGGDELPAQSQLAQLDRLIAAAPREGGRRRPDQVLLSIGGNDSGFVGVLAAILLPPGGYWVPILGPVAVGRFGEAICPYISSGRPLTRLCPAGDSAEARLKGRLPEAYVALANELRARGWRRVSQFAYPNPVSTEHPIFNQEEAPCNILATRDPQTPEEMNGFEALMGHLMRVVRGSHYTWDFELQYYPEQVQGERLMAHAECDWNTDPDDSEICQALWVYYSLNGRIAENRGLHGWNIVGSHLRTIGRHGLCRRQAGFHPALPRVRGGHWDGQWTPQSYRPYDAANERWFRTPNDSIVTQYGDPKHFHHGSFHPTFQAHLAYAQAALEEALER
jgi:hypothetical protein